jgi:hypothetical protein
LRAEVIVEEAGAKVTVPFDLDAAEPVPPWLPMAGWVAWPLVVVLLFCVHQLLVRRHGKKGMVDCPAP